MALKTRYISLSTLRVEFVCDGLVLKEKKEKKSNSYKSTSHLALLKIKLM